MRIVALLLLAGCGTCEATEWDRYLWVTIFGLPSTTTRAELTYEADGERWTCEGTFEPGDEGFAALVDSSCDGAFGTGTYVSEWWVHYPEPRDRRIVLALEVEDGSGATGGFAAQEVLPDWERTPFDEGLCGDRIGRVMLNADGETVRGF